MSYGDRERWWFEHYVSQLQVCLSVEGSKTFPGPGYLHSGDGIVEIVRNKIDRYDI